MQKTHRFGFVVPEETARKFYAVLLAQKDTNVRANLTKVFEEIVERAYQALPEEAQQKAKDIVI